MKKLLAILLCVCLLVPALGLSAVQSVAADEGGYVLTPIGYRANSNTSSHFSVASSFDKIDLTQYGYPETGTIQKGKLGIQFDTYMTGEANNSAAVGCWIIVQMAARGNGKWKNHRGLTKLREGRQLRFSQPSFVFLLTSLYPK